MTLLGLKSSTTDIDFCLDSDNKKDFKKALDKEFKVDIKVLSKYVEKDELLERFNQVLSTYAGRKEDFKYHFKIVLKRFF